MASAGGDKMCPRSSYVDELMIPQLLELIDRYDVDGFWVDGDLWAVAPCYCDRCRAGIQVEDRHCRSIWNSRSGAKKVSNCLF